MAISTLIKTLLPDYVACAERENDDASASLLPEEMFIVSNAVEARIREFTTGRSCARQALEQLGVPPVPLLSGVNREPLWPQGYVGSITHCAGYCGAAVACASQALSIGIDAEVNEPLPPETRSLVMLDIERAWLPYAPAGIFWDRVIFSAKESFYKAWFPLTRAWLDFDDVSIIFDVASAKFHATLLADLPALKDRIMQGWEGRFMVSSRHILTAIAVDQ